MPSPAPLTPVLASMLPGPGASDAEHAKAFRRAAHVLLNHATLFIAGTPHRLAEIEFYWYGPGHQDPFAHRDPIQVNAGVWYFHRQGGTYKGGTYKGVDIAMGRKPDTYIGILIRSIVDPASGTLIEGSCTCVDHVLLRTGKESVAALAGSFEGSIDPRQGSPLYLAHEDPRGGAAEVFDSPRVGLTLKKGATPERRAFLGRPYRFTTEPARTKKGRPHLVVRLHQKGFSDEEIVQITRVGAATAARWVRAFEAGKGKDPDDYRHELSTEELCELWGALA
ncbi:helix-turn-helix domain-containing protein [Polyangium jinanense]|uniref:Uncharacterized protein n=1 Tax=Polyangium jinanense TaxID=2829994 RepID=A0A9X4ARD7_9BACT|nr:helix-turn-helix domain-containing protein [Polyangium jinanense]MDC3952404.1 hypothetical protein [Polyangium jinanense]MDC3980032.1 hypothetical protein [Polyangium jinanense]